MKPIGARIAALAEAEVGNTPCGPNKVDGQPGYSRSCINHRKREAWCADFAKWVWVHAGVLNEDILGPAAASFAKYGPLRLSNPKVGDAVLFNYNGTDRADHVAIVVRVLADGNIVSIGGNERTPDGEVARDPKDGANGYSGAIGKSSYWGMQISGYVSPVEDDMPYTRKDIIGMVKNGVEEELRAGNTKQEILNLVKQGVAAELGAGNTRQEILNLVKKGVAAELGAVHAQEALSGLARQLTDLTILVNKALSPTTPPVTTPPVTPTATTPGAADGSGGAAPPA